MKSLNRQAYAYLLIITMMGSLHAQNEQSYMQGFKNRLHAAWSLVKKCKAPIAIGVGVISLIGLSYWYANIEITSDNQTSAAENNIPRAFNLAQLESQIAQELNIKDKSDDQLTNLLLELKKDAQEKMNLARNILTEQLNIPHSDVQKNQPDQQQAIKKWIELIPERYKLLNDGLLSAIAIEIIQAELDNRNSKTTTQDEQKSNKI